MLTVYNPVVITGQPQTLTRTNGGTASFQVLATGTPAPTCQWLKAGEGGQWTVISGATNSQLQIVNCQLADAGNYAVLVSNLLNVVTSQVATLTVYDPVTITGQPQSLIRTNGGAATFQVLASGTPAPV